MWADDVCACVCVLELCVSRCVLIYALSLGGGS